MPLPALTRPKSVTAKGVAVPWEWKDGKLTIRLPYDLPDNLTTIIDVKL